MALDQVDWWSEIKPILGPLIQAGVVLVVGTFTVVFQLRQARTAERKLFTDLHDKRYKALSSFTNELLELVLQALDEEDDSHPLSRALEASTTLEARQRRSRALANKMEELTWLYGADVMLHVTRMHEHAEKILGILDRLRHKLESDNKVQLVDDINWNNQQMYDALGAINEAARHYLYVGHIRLKTPRIRPFTMDELRRASKSNDGLF